MTSSGRRQTIAADVERALSRGSRFATIGYTKELIRTFQRSMKINEEMAPESMVVVAELLLLLRCSLTLICSLTSLVGAFKQNVHPRSDAIGNSTLTTLNCSRTPKTRDGAWLDRGFREAVEIQWVWGTTVARKCHDDSIVICCCVSGHEFDFLQLLCFNRTRN